MAEVSGSLTLMWFPWWCGIPLHRYVSGALSTKAQLQVVVSDSHQVDQNRRVGQKCRSTYLSVVSHEA